MDDERNQQGQAKGRDSAPGTDSKSETGDPGRTPGKAEGDEETIDEALRKQEQGKKT